KLAGMFPGETEEATSEQGGKERVDKMVNLGREIVEMLRGAGNVRPELTGSIVLAGGGDTGVPADLDINITTSGAGKERQEQWDAIVEIMNDYDGTRIVVPGGTIFVFPMAAGKVQGTNDRIWERRFGYSLTLDGKTKVMPFEVEVKDVGGEVWKEHLLPTAKKR